MLVNYLPRRNFELFHILCCCVSYFCCCTSRLFWMQIELVVSDFFLYFVFCFVIFLFLLWLYLYFVSCAEAGCSKFNWLSEVFFCIFVLHFLWLILVFETLNSYWFFPSFVSLHWLRPVTVASDPSIGGQRVCLSDLYFAFCIFNCICVLCFIFVFIFCVLCTGRGQIRLQQIQALVVKSVFVVFVFCILYFQLYLSFVFYICVYLLCFVHR